MNAHPPFDGEMFDLWKARMKIFIEAYDFEMWDCVINGPFFPTNCINNKVVHKPYNLWTKSDKRKVKLCFKVKYLLMSALRTREYLSIFNFDSAKEIRDILEIIHGNFLYMNKIKLIYMSKEMNH